MIRILIEIIVGIALVASVLVVSACIAIDVMECEQRKDEEDKK